MNRLVEEFKWFGALSFILGVLLAVIRYCVEKGGVS